MLGSVSFCAIAGLLAPALIWELHSVSRCSERALEYCTVLDISPTRIGVRNVSGKSQSAFTERRTYGRYIIIIYEKSTVRLTSVGLAQARPNKMT